MTATLHTITPQSEVFRPKTKAEQRLEYLEGLKRPLTDGESEDLRRSLHAVYNKRWREQRAARAQREADGEALAQHRGEELALLEKMKAEAGRKLHKGSEIE